MGQLGDISPGASVAIGIFVGLISTSIQSLGLTLQRKSHLLEDEKAPHDVRRPPYRRRRWQLGMGMFIISNLVGSSIQITTLPLPVLSTLQASGLVFNSICATVILGEPFTRWSLGGTLHVATGAVLIATFGAIPEPAHSLDQLLLLLGRRSFVIWMVLQAMLVLAITILAAFLGRVPSISSNPRIRLLRGLSYGAISGILSAHSLLVAKSAVELLVRTIVDRKNQFTRWQSWIILLGLTTLALTQLYFLHQGLKLVSTSVLYPLVFCIYNIIAILDGLIYFHQTSLLSPLSAGLITLGTIILLSGVLALSWRLADDQSQPPVAQSALVPGLGLVEDTDDEEATSTSAILSPTDGEAAEHLAFLHGDPMTPTTKYDTVLGATRPLRKIVKLRAAEASEIWNELRDEDTPISPFTVQQQTRPKSSTTLPLSLAIVDNDNEEGRGNEETPLLLRSNSDPNENTGRRGSRHHHHHHKRRRRSTGFPGLVARPEPRDRRRSSQRRVVGQRVSGSSGGGERREEGGAEGVEGGMRVMGMLGRVRNWLRLGRRTERSADGESGMREEDNEEEENGGPSSR